MPFSSNLPTSGTYTLKIHILANAPYVQGPGLNFQTQSVTYTDGGIIIGGTTYKYTNAWTWGGDPTGKVQKGVILDIGGQPWVIMDPGFPAEDYVWTVGNPITNNINADLPGSTDLNYSSLYFAYDNAIRWSGMCFLAGTMISTPSGHVAVEDIKLGMEVLTFDKEGHAVTKKVQGIGKDKVSRVRPDLDLDKAPVRIKKDAFAPNVPFKDCLLTPEHCVYLEGCFVPVRMLVNDKSIYYDRSFVEYEYFHVELEDHSILQSDGLFSESYLNTSERSFSSFEGTLSATTKTWEQDAAVPLNVSREFVEPLYQQFALRAEEMQIPSMERKVVTKSEIYLMDQDGNKVYASKVSGNKHLFYLKNGSENVFIRSDSSTPSDFIGSFVDDRRDLGLLIGEITLLTSNNTVQYTKHLEDETLYGWHGFEGGDYRWTNGDAQLLDLGMQDHCFISIEIKDHRPSVTRVGVSEDNIKISSAA